MLTSQFANVVTFFYPLGNTPALSLTQGLPPEKRADILLLGSGDVRHILFTIHTDARPLDITCCDIEKAVIARNILLLSLCIEDDDETTDAVLWDLYYHFRIDDASLLVLQVQAQKLHSLSTSLGLWHASRYGKLIRICDNESLVKMREMWYIYGLQRNGKELSDFEHQHEAQIRKAEQYKKRLGAGMNLTGLRSISPALPYPYPAEDLAALHEHYWKYGSTNLDQSTLGQIMRINPMFTSPDSNVFLHYGTDPLLGYQLAPAYVPLQSSSLFPSTRDMSSREKAVETAKAAFSAWVLSFRKSSQNITIRFCVADALTFSHSLALQRSPYQIPHASWYRDRFHFDCLILEGGDFTVEGSAPSAFTVIDASNLIDHVGALNLLVATAPLLAHDTAATLYTEKIVRSATTYKGLFADILCGSLPTISMLLNLVLVDCVTNTSALSSGAEIFLDTAIRGLNTHSVESTGQLFTRVAWKRPVRTNDSPRTMQYPEKVAFEPRGLATVLYQVYLNMFENEDVTRMMSDVTVLKLQKYSIPVYQRASFAAFVSFVKARTIVDWQETACCLLSLIENNSSLLMTGNFIQELYVWLHLLDIYSVDTLRHAPRGLVSRPKTNDLRDWSNVPSVVCVTLEVPREKLKIFTSKDVIESGTPPLQCIVQDHSGIRPWQNIFGAIQIGFGKIVSHGLPFSDAYELRIVEDKLGWSGLSPLLVSFHAPTWMLLLQPRTASLELGIQSTPQSVRAFVSVLGITLTVYRTTLSDIRHVHISKHLPNQINAISIPDCSTPCAAQQSVEPSDVKSTITASVDLTTASIVSLTQRAEFLSPSGKAALSAGEPVTATSKTPFNFLIRVGSGFEFTVNVPMAVLESNHRTKIARKSSYIELIIQVAGIDDWSAFSSFTYPVFDDARVVIAWNMPYLTLQSLPIVDIGQPARLGWLTTHTSVMFSDRERSIRNKHLLPASTGEQTRVEFKDSLFSLFMHYSGLQGKRRQTFGLNCPTIGGIQILVFISCLRLDLSNRTVVLDAAVLPLYDALMPRLVTFLQTLTNTGKLGQISTTEAEMRVWKQVLPALVERCRTWSHKSSCEYLITGKIPLSTESGLGTLCSCGRGTVPGDFITDLPYWNTVAQYAVRAAISPCCSAAMFEGSHGGVNAVPGEGQAMVSVCRVCNSQKKADGSDLMSCGRCHRVKYCSKDCQRADWKTHKQGCKAA